jgi:hypothetical protein
MPGAVADRFATRSLDTGLPPPLDTVEARDIAGNEWLLEGRRYADVVGLREHVTVTCSDCGDPIEAGEGCAICGPDSEPVEEHSWRLPQPGRLRQPGWVLFTHGMNTRGTWQEDLVWQLTMAGSAPTPVRVHKYGRVVVGALSRGRLRARAHEVAAEIRKRALEAARSHQPVPGDVIAHSLGTWLIGHALRLESDLCLGRVILTGSILRPDFEWDMLREQGRVEEVLNHRAGRDLPVRAARYAIPDSGPSGVIGFSSRTVIDVLDPAGGHSDYFKDRQQATLRTHLQGLWAPFLHWDRHALPDLAAPPMPDLGRWRWPDVGRTRPLL